MDMGLCDFLHLRIAWSIMCYVSWLSDVLKSLVYSCLGNIWMCVYKYFYTVNIQWLLFMFHLVWPYRLFASRSEVVSRAIAVHIPATSIQANVLQADIASQLCVFNFMEQPGSS